ncbi:MAG: MEDS domain-containing protein [Actinomycetota bacterium]|nr:MEDS domain-containing protein [Actinomycetota bacterium]
MCALRVAEAGWAAPEHACLMYEGEDGFLKEGVRFLAEGVAAGDSVLYLSTRSEDQMRVDVAALGATDQLVRARSLAFLSYPPELDVVPEEQLAYLAEVSEQAMAVGHRGLRVLAELTALAGDPVRRRALLRYEHLADRYMTTHRMTALCVVDRGRVGDEAAAGVDALHPSHMGSGPGSGFRLLPAADGLRITGAVDAWDADRLGELLLAITAEGAEVRLHLEHLQFIGARGLRVLAECRERLAGGGGQLRLVGAKPIVQRAVGVLGLDLS